MKDPNCTPCQEWELCPFHPADEPPATVRDPLSVDGPKRAADSRPDIRQALVLRLLGQDDPEVSDDLIYLDEASGGLVAVPARGEA